MHPFFVELLGTFFLTSSILFTGDPLIIGLTLTALVYAGGPFSGAHYNPAVTLFVFLQETINVKNSLAYIALQLLGAFLASAFYYLLRGEAGYLEPGAESETWRNYIVEIVFTFCLVWVIYMVAVSGKTKGNNYYGIAIGLTVTGIASMGGGISGGAYNPAVGIGPVLFSAIVEDLSLQNLMLYLVGPMIGALGVHGACKLFEVDD